MKLHHYMTKAEFKKKKNVSKILLTALLKCEYLEIFALQHWSDVIHRRVSQYFPVAKNAALLLSHKWFLKGIRCFKLTVYTCMQKLFSDCKTMISDDNDADVLTCIYYSRKAEKLSNSAVCSKNHSALLSVDYDVHAAVDLYYLSICMCLILFQLSVLARTRKPAQTLTFLTAPTIWFKWTAGSDESCETAG